jgi:hypothetical protein
VPAVVMAAPVVAGDLARRLGRRRARHRMLGRPRLGRGGQRTEPADGHGGRGDNGAGHPPQAAKAEISARDRGICAAAPRLRIVLAHVDEGARLT